MIQEVTGDLLLSKAQAIVQSVAPNDHMESGLALALRERWPSMAKDFRHYCRQDHPKPGSAWIWSGPGARIINLLTQEPARDENSHPGKATLANLRHSLDALVKMVQSEKISSLALPKLACGVGGLDWQEVRALIVEKLGSLGIPVVVYSNFSAGVAAAEKLG